MANRTPAYLFRQKYFGHPLQGFFAWLAFAFIRLLPFDTASNIGGWVGRKLGQRLAVTKKARRNLKMVFPEKPDEDIETIITEMWDNLGRTAFEFPLLDRIDIKNDTARFTVENQEYLDLFDDPTRPSILWGGHLANWEVGALMPAHFGKPCTAVFRSPDNKWVSSLFFERGRHPNYKLVPKGPKGAKELTATLRQNGTLGMLVDQKMNDGVAVPFFGRTAMTAPALAAFALKYKCHVVPARIERLGRSAKFKIVLYPPMEIINTGDKKADIITIMTRVNAILEGWIREKPEQWLWLHKRWPDS